MTAALTPEQSARVILEMFKFRKCFAGDPLETSYLQTQFLANHGTAADYAAGLMYAEDSGWLEVTPRGDMQPSDTVTLTAAGFAKM
jgi:hypothetical protein